MKSIPITFVFFTDETRQTVKATTHIKGGSPTDVIDLLGIVGRRNVEITGSSQSHRVVDREVVMCPLNNEVRIVVSLTPGPAREHLTRAAGWIS